LTKEASTFAMHFVVSDMHQHLFLCMFVIVTQALQQVLSVSADADMKMINLTDQLKHNDDMQKCIHHENNKTIVCMQTCCC